MKLPRRRVTAGEFLASIEYEGDRRKAASILGSYATWVLKAKGMMPYYSITTGRNYYNQGFLRRCHRLLKEKGKL